MRWTRVDLVAWLNRPIGKVGWLLLLTIIVAGPAWLFFDPFESITREPLLAYRLHRDDFEYIGRSRNFSRTISNLFVPHNTHVVPAWRLVTWGIVRAAGSISRFPAALGIASYGILVAVMLLAGRLVSRETRRPALGVAAAIITGTSSLMLSAASWYSAGQTLWAGFSILAMLFWLQRWRRQGGAISLILAASAAAISGWLWTVGHVAGLVGAGYLLADRRRSSRRAAIVPLASSILAVCLTAALAKGEVRIQTGTGGSGSKEAISARAGLTHTLQAIPETLVLGNLGVIAETTPLQGAILSLGIGVAWLWSRSGLDRSSKLAFVGDLPTPLEAAGLVMFLSAYLLEWTFRGYLPFSSLRWQVPWYDTIPQIGFVLFLMGWAAAVLKAREASPASGASRKLRRTQAIGLVALVFACVIVNRPRVEEKWHYLAPAMLPSEKLKFPAWLRVYRDNYLFQDQASRQRRHLFKLERAEAIAKAQGVGTSELNGAFGRLSAPLIPDVYDAVGLLDLPEHGSALSPTARTALANLLTVEPEPRPEWLNRDDPWPPPIGAE